VELSRSKFRLSLPDGEIEITDKTTPAGRQQIVDDLRARHPHLLMGNRLERSRVPLSRRSILADNPGLESMIMEHGKASTTGRAVSDSPPAQSVSFTRDAVGRSRARAGSLLSKLFRR
jgi:hypothetical protein